MTAPETGSIADYDALAEAYALVCTDLTNAEFRRAYKAMRACALRCGMPETEDMACMWVGRRLRTYRRTVENTFLGGYDDGGE